MAFLAFAVLAGQASAAPDMETWTGQAAGSTPDLQREGFTLNGPGGVITTNGIAGTLNFKLADGTAYAGYCTDINRLFSPGVEPVETTVLAPPTAAADRALTWILLNRVPTGAETAAKNQAGAAGQVAVWLLVDPTEINTTTPTGDAALNAAAKALVQEALAATASPASLSITTVAPAAGASTSTVTVFGRPGATVTLAVTSGSLSASQVVIGPGGFATTTLTVAGPGTVGITASTAGDGRLISINPTNPQTTPQPTAAAQPTTLTANAQVLFQNTTPVTPTTPTVAPTTPTTVPVARVIPKVSITKTGPARAKVLTKVSYTITVKNTGKVTLKNVTLRDHLPRGLSFVTASRTSTLGNGDATFQIGSLAPGASRTVVVTLMANASVTGSRTNTATVSATGVRPKSAQAPTVFRALIRRVQPAVTG